MTVRTPARQLIILYAGVLALFGLWVSLPGGNLSWSGRWKGIVGGVVVQALIVWRLWHGSTFAWFVGVVLPLLVLVTVYLAGTDRLSLGYLFLLSLFQVAQVFILCARPVRTLVWSQPDKPFGSALQ